MYKNLLISISCIIFANFSWAEVPVGKVLNGRNLSILTLDGALAAVKPGSIVVLGELHGTKEISQAQLEVLSQARWQGLKVSVGMEFFEYPHQQWVDDYSKGFLPEDEFLKKIKWGGFSYDFYRMQVLFPRLDEFVIALNAPRALTAQIAKLGMDSLSDEQKKLLPPQFQLGNAGYKERFISTMGDHVPSAEAVDRYFAAQSVWDDTMAWKAVEFIQSHPDQTLFIIVGEFHAAYGGGLPDRLRARGAKDVISFSMINLHGLSEEERQQEVSFLGKHGPRGDYLWTFDFLPSN